MVDEDVVLVGAEELLLEGVLEMELSELLGSDDNTSVVASPQADVHMISIMLSNRARMRLLFLKNIISTSRLIFCIDFIIIKRF